MKKIFKILLIVIVVLFVLLLAGAFLFPSRVNISENIVIKAKPEVIFDYANCLKKTSLWSPWIGGTEIRFSGPECGVGAVQEWMDNGDPGRQEIIESRAFDYVKTALKLGEDQDATGEIILQPDENGTKVTWTFQMDANYPVGRWIGELVIKPVLGKSYKKGLIKLDSVIMSLPPVTVSNDPGLVNLKSMTMLSIRAKVKMEDIGPKMGEFYSSIYEFIGKNNLRPMGFPIALWHSWSDIDNDMECAAFVDGNPKSDKIVKVSKSYEGKAVVLNWYGPYDSSTEGWKKIDEFIAANGLVKNGIPWDEYVTDPKMEPDTAKWLTKLYQPVK